MELNNIINYIYPNRQMSTLIWACSLHTKCDGITVPIWARSYDYARVTCCATHATRSYERAHIGTVMSSHERTHMSMLMSTLIWSYLFFTFCVLHEHAHEHAHLSTLIWACSWARSSEHVQMSVLIWAYSLIMKIKKIN